MKTLRSFWVSILFVLCLSTVALAASASQGKGVLRGVVNINTASVEELQKLPGIGIRKAESIIAYRDRRKFSRISQITRIKGIGPAMLKKMQPFLVLEGESNLHWEIEDKKAVQ